jgi:hypothetical protein
MDDTDVLLVLAAKALGRYQRRLFIAQVTLSLCNGNARQSEARFGWGRATASQGMHELASGIQSLGMPTDHSGQRSEVRNPQLARDIAALVEPHTQADPELKSTRRYTNWSAAELRQALITHKHYRDDEVPAERTLRDILNRMNYRLKRIQKAKPLKKLPVTDAIFANIDAVKAAARSDPQTLEISMDTKAKVALGEYSRGGKNPHGCDGPRA